MSSARITSWRGSVVHDDLIFAEGLSSTRDSVVCGSRLDLPRGAQGGVPRSRRVRRIAGDTRCVRRAGRGKLPDAVRAHRGAAHIEMLAKAPHRRAGSVTVGGQDHFYLEGQIVRLRCLRRGRGTLHRHALPSIRRRSQSMVAHALALAPARLSRRNAGAWVSGFGGKESQAALIAAAAVLVAQDQSSGQAPAGAGCGHADHRHACYRLHRRLRHRLRRSTDRITALDGHAGVLELQAIQRICPGAVNGSRDWSTSTTPTTSRTSRVISHRCKTHTVSNTAFSGFRWPARHARGHRADRSTRSQRSSTGSRSTCVGEPIIYGLVQRR